MQTHAAGAPGRPRPPPVHKAIPKPSSGEDVWHDIAEHEIVIHGGVFSVAGRFSDIYLGYHTTAGKVALKRLRQAGTNEKEIRNFLREADLWRELRHTHILPFIGTYKCPDGHIHLVSPFAENGDLLTYITHHPDCDKARFLRETADAIAYLHERGIVHGDIKGRNILISSHLHVLLCDFGLSRVTDAIANASSDSQGAGTLRWQSPELLFGEAKTFKSDIYAFGMTIYEVLSGKPPFSEQPSNAAVVMLILQKKRPPKEPKSSLTGTPYARLWDVAERCWAEDPDDRPLRPDLLLAGLPHHVPLRSSATRRASSLFDPLTRRRRKLSMDSTMTMGSDDSDIDEWSPRTPVDSWLDLPLVRIAGHGDDDFLSIQEERRPSLLRKVMHTVVGQPSAQSEPSLAARLKALAFVGSGESALGPKHWTLDAADALLDRAASVIARATLVSNFVRPSGVTGSSLISSSPTSQSSANIRCKLGLISNSLSNFIQNRIEIVRHRMSTPLHCLPPPPMPLADQIAHSHHMRSYMRAKQLELEQERENASHPQPLFSQQHQLIRRPPEFLSRFPLHNLPRVPRAPYLGTTSLLLFGALRTWARPNVNSS